jgi:putative oxidoreductase
MAEGRVARPGMVLVRVVVGIIYTMHAYLGLVVVGPAGIGEYTTRMGYPAFLALPLAWYLVLAHGLGGLALIAGVATRWAALVNLPVIASAFFLHHLRQGFFLTGIIVDPAAGRAVAGGYEYTLLLLAATVALVLDGGGGGPGFGWRDRTAC